MSYFNLKFKKRWQKLSFFEQMANIGSEIERTINWREKNPEYSKLAFERALELIELTITDKKNQKKGMLKEILRTKELLIDYFCFNNRYKTNDKIWQNYFFAFNYASLAKGKDERDSSSPLPKNVQKVNPPPKADSPPEADITGRPASGRLRRKK